jgi:hypothetical protein
MYVLGSGTNWLSDSLSKFGVENPISDSVLVQMSWSVNALRSDLARGRALAGGEPVVTPTVVKSGFSAAVVSVP